MLRPYFPAGRGKAGFVFNLLGYVLVDIGHIVNYCTISLPVAGRGLGTHLVPFFPFSSSGFQKIRLSEAIKALPPLNNSPRGRFAQALIRFLPPMVPVLSNLMCDWSDGFF